MTQSQKISHAIDHLKAARDLLTHCPRSLERVRAALKSADGAKRNAELAEMREQASTETAESRNK